MAVLLVTHPAAWGHHTGPGHPERAARLDAVLQGIEAAGLGDAVRPVTPRAATLEEIEAVHGRAHIEMVRSLCDGGGGRIDADTRASAGSWEAALVAAGAGLDAAGRIEQGEADAAFLALRPPGHHATAGRAMGFCLFNNVAITAAGLAARGERVVVLDWDAHHGNGTQDVFYDDDRVLYISLHQFPLYPGTGRLDETGSAAGAGCTVNVPVPPGATGDVYRAAFDTVIAPAAARFEPTWWLVSAGFDAHRADPLTDLGLTAGDFEDLAARARHLAGGRVIAFLEGGYDLEALAASAGGCVAALAGTSWRPEPPSSGGPGADVVAAVRAFHSL